MKYSDNPIIKGVVITSILTILLLKITFKENRLLNIYISKNIDKEVNATTIAPLDPITTIPINNELENQIYLTCFYKLYKYTYNTYAEKRIIVTTFGSPI